MSLAFDEYGRPFLIIKVHVASMRDYHRFLTQGLQLVEGVRFTESFICLDQPISRSIQLAPEPHSEGDG